MAIKLGSAFVEILGDDGPLTRAFDRARTQTVAFGGVLQGMLQGVGQRLFDGIVRGAQMMITKFGEAVQASSNLSESINKVNVVFGENAAAIMEWSKTSSTALGQSQQTALEAVGTFGNLFTAMGVTGEEAKNMSISLVELASDIASFNNITPDEALIKLRAGIVGEIEPLRTVGVQLEAVAVANRAVKMGLAESTAAVSMQDKVMARYALILEQTAIQHGDFERTSKGLANAQRILAAQMQNGAATLGNSFRPALESIVNLMIGIAPQMFSYGQNITDQFASGLAAGIRAIIPVITTIRQLFTYWFKPGSPPNILPDIDKWGQGTLQAWLDGMASVDVKAAFDTVGKAVENVLRSFVGAGKMDEFGLVGQIFGTRDAIAAAVGEFRRLGSVSESTIQKIASKAGPAGAAIAKLTESYFDLQRASEKVKTAQDALNRTTEQYDRIISPLRDSLDQIRGQQQALANEQRKIAANNTLNNFEATAAEKAAAALELQQIALEDQIAVEEKRRDAAIESGEAALDTATKEEQAAQQALDAAQATIDRQVETNNLLAEQKRLVEQLAAAQEAAAAQAKAAAEKAANEAEQAAEKAKREAEQLAAAQLRYNLEIADTPGKIALMEAELAKLTPGTVEYFDTLTRITQLQEQYRKELEAAAKAASKMGDDSMDAASMLGAGVTAPLTEASGAALDLSSAIDEMAAAFTSDDFSSIPDDVKRVADSLSEFVDGVEKIAIATGLLPDQTSAALEKVNEDTRTNLEHLAEIIGIATALINGDWSTAWDLYQSYVRDKHDEVNEETERKLRNLWVIHELWQKTINWSWENYWKDIKEIWRLATASLNMKMGEWGTQLQTAVTKIGTDIYKGGANIMTSLWDGMKSKWGEVEGWFSNQLTWLRAQLPFSEPKDPSSPLRGLQKSGESIVGMVQSGMERASMTVEPLAAALLPQGPQLATQTTTTNHGPVTINLSFGGPVDDGSISKVKSTLLDTLRASGVIS